VLAVNSLLAGPITRSLCPDIVHETYFSAKRIAPKRAKVILTVFDMIHEKFSDNFPSTDPASRYKSSAVKRADHIICISEHTRQDLLEIVDVDPAKTSVVHLGFSLMKMNGSEHKTLFQSRPFILYVGERSRHKNFMRLLEAYAQSPVLRKDFDLLCFGGGKFSTKEKSLLKGLGLSGSRVRHIYGDDALLASCYSSASVFVYPSLYEGFGIPPLEAMSFGCPVVCSGVSSIPEVVGDAAAMFDPYKPESIRKTIEEVVYEDAERESLIARGHERIKVFSWQRCARETLDVYRRLLS
jgi:glycosyltransferase involved in cell wall biosynthesis